jgi:hypothetical protein
MRCYTLLALAHLSLTLAPRTTLALRCPAKDFERFDDIARISYESGGPVEYSDGQRACTRECCLLIKVWSDASRWTSCGQLLETQSETRHTTGELATEGMLVHPYHHTNVLVTSIAASGYPTDTLTWAHNENAPCYEQVRHPSPLPPPPRHCHELLSRNRLTYLLNWNVAERRPRRVRCERAVELRLRFPATGAGTSAARARTPGTAAPPAPA